MFCSRLFESLDLVLRWVKFGPRNIPHQWFFLATYWVSSRRFWAILLFALHRLIFLTARLHGVGQKYATVSSMTIICLSWFTCCLVCLSPGQAESPRARYTLSWKWEPPFGSILKFEKSTNSPASFYPLRQNLRKTSQWKYYIVTPILPPVVREPVVEYNRNYVLYWGSFALDSNRITTSLSNGPGNSPPSSARFLANLRIEIIDV